MTNETLEDTFWLNDEPWKDEAPSQDNSIEPAIEHGTNHLRLKRIGTGVLIVAALVGGVYGLSERFKEPTYSKNNIVFKSESSNDTVWGISGLVDGHEAVDRRVIIDHIKNMPENVETLKDGLHIGDQIVVPESVTP